MHPHLVGESKQQHCADLIRALEDCHARGWWTKITGGCNGIKEDLNLCLRAERIERTKNHIQQSKEKRKKTEEIWKAIDDES
ncbi:uncharacterized protein PFL1_00336 [Pseudozyma flocculosa PF-1]|uniref:COX assembly mitochondrial protein n=1 Tax=Pseudozyma flocculosa TaxID=84751 RepID=A0A5C3ES69_9BASI|nr:uncharacterized protein PFL1_00336 [Pseudozyma flocculosa PF-1]EPQ32139.1 hypothetical protein PFL1_00336 [Pseudozyma flocculosa PF-1]SPO34922.1 related to CMC2 - protein of the mitochondrial intermembrane space involved in respiratory chain complex assembly [Pseudozyma flocculosa]